MPDVKPLSAEEIAELRERQCATIAQAWTVRQQSPIVIPAENAAFLVAANNLVPRLLDEVERTRALLRRIQWRREPLSDSCAVCESHEYEGHQPGCELAALLGGEG
jgi:hypothetical protein